MSTNDSDLLREKDRGLFWIRRVEAVGYRPRKGIETWSRFLGAGWCCSSRSRAYACGVFELGIGRWSRESLLRWPFLLALFSTVLQIMQNLDIYQLRC